MLSEWRAAAVEAGGGKPTADEWRPVEVPGRPAAFAGEDRVAYRTAFDDPRGPDEAMALLELRGLYAHATVWLNDEPVAESETYFEPVFVPFEPDDENELIVECRAPDDRFGGIHDTDRVPDAASVPGIWWGAELTTHPETFVVDVRVTPRLTGDGAAIDAEVEVYAGAAFDDRITLTTRPAGERRGRGMMDRAAVQAAAGERTVAEHTIDLRDPSLWWPRGMGEQSRYEVRAKLDDDVATATTGLATVEETADGLAVNGEPVPVRGVALQDAAVGDVDRAIEVNANLVRAHAHALSPAVYDACDEAGLLVWQDLPLTGPGLFDIQRGEEVAGVLARTYSSRPSLAAVGVHDEPTATFGDRLGSGLLDRFRFRWRVWRSEYDRGPADEVAAALPDDVPVFPVVGEPGTEPDAAALYPGWDYGTAGDLSWVLDRYDLGDVVGEFGAGSLADGDPEPDEIAGFDPAKHDAAVAAADVEGDGVAASQAYQAEVVRSVAERLRADGSKIVVANALRDAGDAGMGVFCRDGSPKEAADELASAFRPVRTFLADPTAGETDLVVVNDAPEAVSGTLSWSAGEESGSAEVAVDAADKETVGTATLPDDAETVELTLTLPAGEVRDEYHL